MKKTPYLVAYPFVFEPEEDGGYFIHCPDIQGVYTEIPDDDIAFGINMAEEVLGMVLADYIESGETVPPPTNLKDVDCPKGCFINLISVDIQRYFRDNTPVKKTLTIPKWADELGKKLGINFSKLLTDSISELGLVSKQKIVK